MRQILIFITVLLWNSLALAEQAPSIRYMLGQKLMLDLRYFCTDGTSAEKCRTPVTVLPDELAKLLAEQHIGGVILFAENMQNEQQLKALTTSLQSTQSELLFIATDQEGGRVARLPSEYLPAFSGAMALGAVPQAERLSLAHEVAVKTGQALREVGININFAPTVDVNSNPDNPVINVRSFGDEPKSVAELGLTMTKGLLASGVLPALKHFPGHGDTYVDSHAGLPVVTHDKKAIMKTDVYPFSHIITHTQNAAQLSPLVMTAHIQFPALDSSTLRVDTQFGEKEVIRPATLSKIILTDVLRKRLGFNGLIVTDALDMAGITQFFSADTAVLETWRAGSDIALMPFSIRTPGDIQRFRVFLDNLERGVKSEDLVTLRASHKRIQSVKRLLHDMPVKKEQYREDTAQDLAKKLAQQSITLLSNRSPELLSKLRNKLHPNLLMVMPDLLRCKGMREALKALQKTVKVRCLTTAISNAWSVKSLKLEQYDALIWGELSPAQSIVEMGGMEDWVKLKNMKQFRATIAQQHSILDAVLAKQAVRDKIILLGLRAPYAVMQRASKTAATYVLYDYRVDSKTGQSPTFTTFVSHLLQGEYIYGQLPVSAID
jgi:beta-N-acetylhexosaminidase